MNRSLLFAVLPLFVVVLSSARAASDEPKTPPAARMTDAERVEKVAALIQAVAEAQDPRSAASAYAHGNALDADSVKLHEAYMTRMLKFGLVKIAAHPAKTLLRLEREHPMALAVLGYAHGRDGELAAAFDATIRAAVNMPKDPSVLHNVGQLAAWYDHERDLPELSPAARRLLEKLRPQLAQTREYNRAYEDTAREYEQSAAIIADCDLKLPDVEAAVNESRARLVNAEFEYRAVREEVESGRRLIESLWRQLSLDDWRRSGPHGGYNYHDDLRRRNLLERIRQEELALELARARSRRILAQADINRTELYVNETRLVGLQEQRDQALSNVYRRFRWDPPAVEGLVTPEVDRFVFPPRERAPRDEDPEDLAAVRLRVAKLYLRSDLTEKAVEILNKITADYDQTKAAAEAAALLEKIRSEE